MSNDELYDLLQETADMIGMYWMGTRYHYEVGGLGEPVPEDLVERLEAAGVELPPKQ